MFMRPFAKKRFWRKIKKYLTSHQSFVPLCRLSRLHCPAPLLPEQGGLVDVAYSAVRWRLCRRRILQIVLSLWKAVPLLLQVTGRA